MALALGLFLLAILTFTVGGIWGIVNAFRVSALWGLGILLTSFFSGTGIVWFLFLILSVIFWVKHWDYAKGPFLVNLMGWIMLLGGFWFNYQAYKTTDEVVWAKIEAQEPDFAEVRGLMEDTTPLPDNVQAVPGLVVEGEDGKFYAGIIVKVLLSVPLNAIYYVGERGAFDEAENAREEAPMPPSTHTPPATASPTASGINSAPADDLASEYARLQAWHHELQEARATLSSEDKEALAKYERQAAKYDEAFKAFDQRRQAARDGR